MKYSIFPCGEAGSVLFTGWFWLVLLVFAPSAKEYFSCHLLANQPYCNTPGWFPICLPQSCKQRWNRFSVKCTLILTRAGTLLTVFFTSGTDWKTTLYFQPRSLQFECKENTRNLDATQKGSGRSSGDWDRYCRPKIRCQYWTTGICVPPRSATSCQVWTSWGRSRR